MFRADLEFLRDFVIPREGPSSFMDLAMTTPLGVVVGAAPLFWHTVTGQYWK